MQSLKIRTHDADVFGLSREELDELPFGVIGLDRKGLILRYNRREKSLSSRLAVETLGLSFFQDVAPCANVAAFRGRFDAFAQNNDSGIERFHFTFAFRWGRENVSITLLRKAGLAEINVLVRARSGGVPSRPPHVLPFPDPAAQIEVRLPVVLELDAADGFALRDRVHRDDLVRVSAIVTAAARDRTAYAVEYQGIARDAEQLVFAEHGFFGSGFVKSGYATKLDVTEQRRSSALTRHAANYDALTGLPNQRLLNMRVAAAIHEAETNGRIAAVIIANIDSFRSVNETFGFDVGDDVLRAVGLRLGEFVRSGDTVAHIVADWFVVLLTDLDSAQSAAGTAARLIGAVARPLMIQESAYYVSLRAGISVAPSDSRDCRGLMQAAATAVYAARERGTSGVRFYSAELASEAASRLSRQNELRAAIANHEFELLYQPQIEVESNRVIAAEALIRWNHPVRGCIPPLDFIPLADRTGLIVPLGEWVLRTACRQARTWADGGYDVRVCVNVSAVQFQRADFVDMVAAIVAEFDLAPGLIELELTESIMVAGFSAMTETLNRLKALGLRLAIDDFGTGYSSLSYLKHFPVDTLKIDRAFITDIVADRFDQAIATTIFTLTEKLNLECVVEGVEDAEQLRKLRGIGCSVVQGFYYSRPITPEQLTPMLARTGASDHVVRSATNSATNNTVL